MKKSADSLTRIRTDVGRSWYMTGAMLSFIGLLITWAILSYGEYVNTTFLPTPSRVLAVFVQMLQSPNLWSDIGISVYRVTMGFLLAAVIGIPLGVLAGTFKFAEAAIQPLTEFIRYMPATAFIPLVMVWAGIGEGAKILVIFIGTFFQMVLMVADNIRLVPEDLLSASYTLGATRFQVITRVLIPAMMPNLMDTLRLMIGWAWTYLVVAELVAANSGLGYSILKAQRFLKTDVIFVGILVIGILGLLTDRLFAFVNKKLFPWAEGGS
ncbi:ABC-type transporter, integral membrane subunit [Desulfotomaculum nigrificans CO-1-SRB]|uniref:ABC-type transporter, integral membrane subunit n=1 Tax=Desulfotomaculum nigrificans (strain DSM 14880 / VKM B-2319 / CO-1-SRB) TaxID=868595 RepID=F6B307_DESCC|nr:ABC transporter permease [Desulfotomaculum nigrificans]AEF93911.1 ABC-type transporter, integral membrane subunit [Desulfotomaculum nigrificans CO-1-SRB]